MFFVILIPLVHLLPNYGQLYSWKTYMLFKVNCYLCIFNTIRLVYYNLMICLKYHCKVILEEIDSFSTGRLFFFGRKGNGSTFGVCAMWYALGMLVLIIRGSGCLCGVGASC